MLRPDEKLVEWISFASRFQGESSPTEKKTSSVLIPADGHSIYGDLTTVPAAKGIVVFAHGSGSSRQSSIKEEMILRLLQASSDGRVI